MKPGVSLTSERFRRTALAFFALGTILPLLILIFIILQYAVPILSHEQTEAMINPFTYGLVAMFTMPLLGFALMIWWTNSLERLTEDIRNKSLEVVSDEDGFHSQNEMVAIRHIFDGLQSELQDKIGLLNEYSQKLIESNVKLSELAITDALTQLYNKRHFEMRLAEEVNRASRSGEELSLIMADVDGFKKFNDTHGHQAGDKLLRVLGQAIKASIRKSDIAFRYGGDEFSVILPGCSVKDAGQVAKKLVASMTTGALDTLFRDYPADISISCGVARYSDGLEDLVTLADRCLYKAKSLGRGQIVMARRHKDGA